ncbi:hypothetical protein SO694_00045213 [Aureococcus anophagefferens]|uniref:Uncharacterized protein n=1 Tax=Aureococcus anophagefferens TaxID=44056 RepID=A0ABR1G7B0_AURAN
MWWRRLAAPTARTWRAPVRVSSSAARLRDDVFFAPASAVLAPFPRPAPLPPRRPERDLRRRADPCRDAEAALHDGLAAGGDAGRLFADALSAYAAAAAAERRALAAVARAASPTRPSSASSSSAASSPARGPATPPAPRASRRRARGHLGRGHRAAVLCCVRSGDVGAALRAAALKAPESPRGEAQLRRLLRSAMFRRAFGTIPVLGGRRAGLGRTARSDGRGTAVRRRGALCRAGEVDAAIALAARSVDADGDDAAALLAALRARARAARRPGPSARARAPRPAGADAALDALVDALDAGEALTLGDFDAALDVAEAAGRHATPTASTLPGRRGGRAGDGAL